MGTLGWGTREERGGARERWPRGPLEKRPGPPLWWRGWRSMRATMATSGTSLRFRVLLPGARRPHGVREEEARPGGWVRRGDAGRAPLRLARGALLPGLQEGSAGHGGEEGRDPSGAGPEEPVTQVASQ